MANHNESWECFYCGWKHPEMSERYKKEIKLYNLDKKVHYLRLEYDHPHPKSKGGTITVESCGCCNRRKGKKDLEEFLQFIKNDPICQNDCFRIFDLKGGKAFKLLTRFKWIIITKLGKG